MSAADMHAPDLLVCCRCGCIASRAYRAPAGTPCTERDPRMWETHNGPKRQVCGGCIGKALGGALSAMHAYATSPAGVAQLEREARRA